MPALWVYKCDVEAEAEGDWNYFFHQMRGRGRWGGTWCIKNAASRKILVEQLRVGDLILAWQTNERAALGLCRISRLPNDGRDVSIVLETIRRFRPPIELLPWKKRSPGLANGKAFAHGNRGTPFETTTEEAQAILEICGVPKNTLRQKARA